MADLALLLLAAAAALTVQSHPDRGPGSPTTAVSRLLQRAWILSLDERILLIGYRSGRASISERREASGTFGLS